MNHTNTASTWNPSADDLRLIRTLGELDGPADRSIEWPSALWESLKEAQAPRWSLPTEFGGLGLEKAALIAAETRIAMGSLTAAFILSQHDAAVRRLAASPDRPTSAFWLDAISTGEAFATVGLSQLTTSRRLGATALRATEIKTGHYLLQGAMPWVTAADQADVFVAGAVLEDNRQLLFALPADRAGVSIRQPYELAALGASRTCEVGCEDVELSQSDLLADPSPNVMTTGSAVGTGGLETSALALGLARAAIDALVLEGPAEAALTEPAQALTAEWNAVWADLDANAQSKTDAASPAMIRAQANSLALRSTQAFLTARKGSGFLKSDPAQRWARQALFFLVWSCPRPVAQAAIRDMAGLCELNP